MTFPLLLVLLLFRPEIKFPGEIARIDPLVAGENARLPSSTIGKKKKKKKEKALRDTSMSSSFKRNKSALARLFSQLFSAAIRSRLFERTSSVCLAFYNRATVHAYIYAVSNFRSTFFFTLFVKAIGG